MVESLEASVPILDDFKKSTFYRTFVEVINTEKSLLMEGLWDAPKALLLQILQETTKNHILVVIDGEEENRLFQDLSYFCSEAPLEFPAWEAFIGEEIPPSHDIMGKRLETLTNLQNTKEPKIILCPLKSLIQKIIPPSALTKLVTKLHKGENIPFEVLTNTINKLNYVHTKLVTDKGQYTVRGGIIDIFPTHVKAPYRIEFFGDQIDQIRIFDVMSQKSKGVIDNIEILHANEYDLIVDEKNPTTLLDYLPGVTLVFDDLLKLENRFASLSSLMKTYPKYFVDLKELLHKHNRKLFWTKETLEELTQVISKGKKGRSFYSGRSPIEEISFEICNETLQTKRCYHPFLQVRDFLQTDDIEEGLTPLVDKKISFHFLYDDEKEKEKIQTIQPFPVHFSLTKGYLSSGFAIEESGIVLLPYTEFTNRYKMRRSGWRSSYHTPISEFHTIEDGDLVVHFHNGIGKYLGVVKQKNHLGIESEFLIIEYANQSKLYVPVSQSHLVSKYIGTKEEIPTLHTLGTSAWTKSKAKVQQAIIGYAKDLLQLQAERELRGGFAFKEDSKELEEFFDAFPYTETEDQLKAFFDINQDMQNKLPMDRLVCGDVGYGKTEVAMRAAFKAVVDGGKQVAVLVPTTVLAVQHYETFKDRMDLFPITVGVASRFQSAKEIKKTLEDVKEGKIDILVGTHRLISKDVSFKDLGLIIIDEEQRFGVKTKEALKHFKVDVDCLTMTATPIPRTLYLSLVGAKKMSVINSPPQDRLPIRSIIAEKDEEVIKTAILRELARDGQVFFIHNRVESIHKVAEELQTLAPAANIAVAHGQMSADIIDNIFHKFKRGEIDILVATTIIENGIDIPNANTILIDRADTFGISDLYQLRGRVGRWNKTAYCYFLVPKNRSLQEVSQKRLQALIENSGFGGGIKLAMRDLEIRGAGDILGTQQSGHAASIGFHLYCKLLKKAVDALKKKEVTTFFEAKLEFTFEAKLPASYVPDSSLRLEIYHRLGETSTYAEAQEILDELKDRFGPPPNPVIWLYHMTRLRIFANEHHFVTIKFLNHSIQAERQLTNETKKKTFLIPPVISAEELEKVTIKRLSEEFNLP